MGPPVFLFLFVILFDGFGWHMANRWNFAFSDAPYHTAYYPIISAKGPGRRHHYTGFEIDPYDTGEAAEIPVPTSQFTRDYEGLCIAVPERRNANGAVQIKINRKPFLSEPDPVSIIPCR